MDVTYADSVKKQGALYPLVQQATSRLEEVLGRSAATMKVQWDQAKNASDRPAFVVHISDGTDSATATLAPDDLENPHRTNLRLRFLWEDVLRERSERLLRNLQAMDGSEN